MPRAKRHFLPGYIWHLTHRCHQREFLLKSDQTKSSYLGWLAEAKRRFRLCVLDYIVTSNHVHLLAFDQGAADAIPKSMHLAASPTAQEYNLKNRRRGAFWEDRYHLTAIEDGRHFLRCLVYIDLNMVRAGVVEHPSEWAFSGYPEIQGLPSKFTLVDFDVLLGLLHFKTDSLFRDTYNALIEEAIESQNLAREKRWTETVAVGSRVFVEAIQKKLGGKMKRSKIVENDKAFELREERGVYRR